MMAPLSLGRLKLFESSPSLSKRMFILAAGHLADSSLSDKTVVSSSELMRDVLVGLWMLVR